MAQAAAAAPTLQDRLRALTNTSDFGDLLTAVEITATRQSNILNQLTDTLEDLGRLKPEDFLKRWRRFVDNRPGTSAITMSMESRFLALYHWAFLNRYYGRVPLVSDFNHSWVWDTAEKLRDEWSSDASKVSETTLNSNMPKTFNTVHQFQVFYMELETFVGVACKTIHGFSYAYLLREDETPKPLAELANLPHEERIAQFLPWKGPGYKRDRECLFGFIWPLLQGGIAEEHVIDYAQT